MKILQFEYNLSLPSPITLNSFFVRLNSEFLFSLFLHPDLKKYIAGLGKFGQVLS